MTFRLRVPYIADVDTDSMDLFLLLEVGGGRYGSVGFVYEAPRRPQVSFVSRQSGTVLGGDTISVKFVNLEFLSTEAPPVIKVSFGNQEATVPSFVLTGNAAGMVEFVTPRYVQVGVVNVVMEIAGIKTLGTYTLSFDYEYKRQGAPEIQSYVPDSSRRGEPTSVSVKCTSVLTEHTGDLSVHFMGTDGAKVAVSTRSVSEVSGTRLAVTVVTFDAPTDLSEGVYVVSMTWYDGTEHVAFDFTVLPSLRASIIKLQPSSALSSGGDEIVVQVSELRPVERVNQIRVAFGQ